MIYSLINIEYLFNISGHYQELKITSKNFRSAPKKLKMWYYCLLFYIFYT